MNKMRTAFALVGSICLFVQGVVSQEPPNPTLRSLSARFAQDAEKLHKTIFSAFDEAVQAANKQGNKKQLALIQAERSRFANQRILPVWLKDDIREMYSSRMSQNCEALISGWGKHIDAQRKKRDEASARHAELMLGNLLIQARGYGIALPSMADFQNVRFLIRNVETDLVMEVNDKGELVLEPELITRTRQHFRLLGFDESVAIQNCEERRVLNVPYGSKNPDTKIILYSTDGKDANEKWRLSEEGRQIAITSLKSGLVLSVAQEIGNSTLSIVQQFDQQLPRQRWIFEPINQ